MSRPPRPGVPGARVSPDVSMGRATCPLLWGAALGAAQPCGVSLTTRGIAPACLQYDRLTLVAWVLGPLCLAGDPLLYCVPARLSPVASMAPCDVFHGPRCSLAGPDQRPWGTAPAAGPVGLLRRPSGSDPWGVGSFLSLGCPTCARVCGVLGHFAPVHRCARSMRCVACAVSLVTSVLFTGVPARRVVLRVPCPGPLGSCSAVRLLGAFWCVCGVLDHLVPVHRCARSVCCFACAVSWATSLLFAGVPVRCVVVRVRCPGPLGSCSPVCPRGSLCCVCGVLAHLAPVHRCARWVCCHACAVSWATWLLFTGAPAQCVALLVRCPGPLSSRSPVCPLGVFCRVCGVLGHLAPVCRCARSVRCFARAVSWATWLSFTAVPAQCAVVRVRCPGPLGSCSPVCPLAALCCSCGVLGHLSRVQQCARSVCCVACAASWATWLLSGGVPARCVVSCVRCRGPLRSCSPVSPLAVLCCVCGVLGHLAPVHRCTRTVCCVPCAVSWATWLRFTGVPALCVVLRVWYLGPLVSCSLLCPLCTLCCACGLLGLLALAHRCARSVRCVASPVSWAPWVLYTDVLDRCVLLRVRCPGPRGSCSPVCPLARVVLRVRCPGPLGSCSSVSPLCVLCGACAFLGLLAPVHRCACSVCCVARAVSSASWLLFTGVPAPWVALRLRCHWPLGSCSPGSPLAVLCCVSGVLGHLAPVHPRGRTMC